jgi:hypothetical protein
MTITQKIRQLIKSSLVIRHRTEKEMRQDTAQCLICCREIVLPRGALCLAINEEGLVCSVCGALYAPELVKVLGEQQAGASGTERMPKTDSEIRMSDSTEWIDCAREIEVLLEITAELAKGIARGIVEAPAGHIGLMHYAKDIKKPPRKENESEKDYELRVRTHRMTKLYDKIFTDTTGRVAKLKAFLEKCGLPVAEKR